MSPFLWTVCLSLCICGTVATAEPAMRRLGQLVALAIKKAGLTDDYVSLVTGIPRPKLSDMLNGKVRFTGLDRILLSRDIREDTLFWVYFADGLANEMAHAVVPRDLGTLLGHVERFFGEKRAMVKASMATLPEPQKEIA